MVKGGPGVERRAYLTGTAVSMARRLILRNPGLSREDEITRKRFGLDAMGYEVEPLTLKRIAEEYGLSKQRVHQIVTRKMASFH